MRRPFVVSSFLQSFILSTKSAKMKVSANHFCSQKRSSPLTLIEKDNGVCRVVLNNSKKRNALSLEMIEELQENIVDKSSDVNVRCIILSSIGSVFSSGHDLKELKTSSETERRKIFEKCTDLMLGIRKCPVPVIAQVRGLAAAAGCQLISSCDIVIASEKSFFSTPGASVGLFCSTPGIEVSRMVPRKMSAYMLFTGNPITAREALQCGLVSRVTTEEELDNVTNDAVNAILSKSRSVISLGKEFYYKQLEQGIENAYRDGVDVMVENLRKEDATEGIQAFFEKRQPQWKHS